MYPVDVSRLFLNEISLVVIHEHKTLPLALNVEGDSDLDKLCNHIKVQRRIMVRAEYGGCGRRHTCKPMEQR